MKLNDIKKKKLIKEAFECVNHIEFLLSSIDAKLAKNEKRAA